MKERTHSLLLFCEKPQQFSNSLGYTHRWVMQGVFAPVPFFCKILFDFKPFWFLASSKTPVHRLPKATLCILRMQLQVIQVTWAYKLLFCSVPTVLEGVWTHKCENVVLWQQLYFREAWEEKKIQECWSKKRKVMLINRTTCRGQETQLHSAARENSQRCCAIWVLSWSASTCSCFPQKKLNQRKSSRSKHLTNAVAKNEFFIWNSKVNQ